MTAHNQDPKEGWENIAEDVLNGMAIDCSHGYRSCPFVMLFVDEFVDVLAVEEAMGVVEANLLHQDAYCQLQENPVECGQLSIGHNASESHYLVCQEAHGNTHDKLIEQHRDNDLHEPLVVHRFIRSRLDLVLPQNCGFIRDVHDGV